MQQMSETLKRRCREWFAFLHDCLALHVRVKAPLNLKVIETFFVEGKFE